VQLQCCVVVTDDRAFAVLWVVTDDYAFAVCCHR